MKMLHLSRPTASGLTVYYGTTDMNLKNTYIGHSGVIYLFEYSDADSAACTQVYAVCTARPYGPFVSDPAGSITEIKLVDPKDYKQYFDWGNIGDRIVERSLELLPRLT